MAAIATRFVDCHIFRRTAHGDEWLVMKRAPGILLGGTWQMVSGHIDDGETAYEAAFRELQEETGLTPLHFFQGSYVNRFYLAQTDEVILSPVFCAEVPADAEVVLSDEHTDYAWVDHREAMERYPWPGQRKSLRIVRQQFVEHEPRKESVLDHLVGL